MFHIIFYLILHLILTRRPPVFHDSDEDHVTEWNWLEKNLNAVGPKHHLAIHQQLGIMAAHDYFEPEPLCHAKQRPEAFLKIQPHLHLSADPVSRGRHPEDVITAPFRLYEYFGLRNAVQTFQSYMAEVARGYQFCFVYLDDVLAAGHHQNHFTMLYH
ncbi:hypothetical protein T4E_5715 [Trichinella pseudospiralis]|uniref:Uncharacterized protein n=1 Tax=Trichinella pseudospiralis TaxID=6337 RepID=A0A0V0Y1P8_TRIPS|nr:hypothetical protein T4E_5715 [Trichinella pseudospiralis]